MLLWITLNHALIDRNLGLCHLMYPYALEMVDHLQKSSTKELSRQTNMFETLCVLEKMLGGYVIIAFFFHTFM